MNGEFGKETPLTQSEPNKHSYLGMTMEYTHDGEVIINMSEYIQTILQDAPADMNGTSATPAGNHLFKVNEDGPRLDKATAETYVHLVMQLLYLSQRGRPNIRTAVSFLCTCLNVPDRDDYKKVA